MRVYKSYKPSGVDWIGEIPKEWNLKRIKYLFKSIVEKSIDGSEELLSVSEKKGIIPRRELRDENEELTRSESLEGYLKVNKDDLNDMISADSILEEAAIGGGPGINPEQKLRPNQADKVLKSYCENLNQKYF
jgi:type I restriction enzyme S subunit